MKWFFFLILCTQLQLKIPFRPSSFSETESCLSNREESDAEIYLLGSVVVTLIKKTTLIFPATVSLGTGRVNQR